MRLGRWVILVAALAVPACSSNQEGPDAGLDASAVVLPGADASASDAGSADVSSRLAVSATPIFVTDIPTSEKAVSGQVMVTRGSTDVQDALVTVNGVTIPHWTASLYDVDAVDVPGIGPGSTITIQATTTDPPETRTLTFTCPPAIEFTAPAANALIAASQILAVTWAPGIRYDAMRIAGGPILGFFACYTQATGSEVSSMGHGAEFLDLEVGQTSHDLAVNEGCKRYLLEIQYPGETVMVMERGAADMGYCSVRHRIWLRGN
jgi:hypothetical protein